MGTHHELKNRNLIINAPDNWIVGNDTQDDTWDLQNDTQGKQNDTQESIIPNKNELDSWIEEQIRKNPKITTEQLALMSHRSVITIKRHIAKLAHIKFVGRGFSGRWEIVDK